MSGPRPVGRDGGHLMVGLMVMVAIMMILSTVVFQAWGDVVRRDNEAEMMFRAREICRGLQRFQKDRGTLPTKLDQLIEPGSKGQYFLRKLYTDPLVTDGKWGLLFLAPGGGIYDPNGVEGGGVDAMGNPVVAPAGSPFGGAQQGGGSALSRMGQPQRDEQMGGRLGAGAGGQRRGAFGGSAFGGGPGGEGETGLPIAGVKSLCKERPFRVFREQEDYAKWLFAFNDQDLQPPPLPGMGPATPPQFPGQQQGSFPGQLTPGGKMGQGGSGQPMPTKPGGVSGGTTGGKN